MWELSRLCPGTSTKLYVLLGSSRNLILRVNICHKKLIYIFWGWKPGGGIWQQSLLLSQSEIALPEFILVTKNLIYNLLWQKTRWWDLATELVTLPKWNALPELIQYLSQEICVYSSVAEKQVVESGNRAYCSAKVQFPAPSSGTMPSDNGHFLNWEKVIKLLHNSLFFMISYTLSTIW